MMFVSVLSTVGLLVGFYLALNSAQPRPPPAPPAVSLGAHQHDVPSTLSPAYLMQLVLPSFIALAVLLLKN